MRTVSGEETTSVPVPAGTNVLISILGANRNKDVWGADADEWRPERWLTASGAGRDVDAEFGNESRVGTEAPPPGSMEGAKYPGVYGGMLVSSDTWGMCAVALT